MITLTIGKMGAGKSAKLIEDFANETREKIVIAPSNKVKSRNGNFIFTDLRFSNLFDGDKYNYKTNVFVDECQFLSVKQIKYLINTFMNINFYGLDEYAFNQKIESIEYLKSITDIENHLTTKCRICKELIGVDFGINIPLYEKGNKDKRYINLCNECYNRLKEIFNDESEDK